jgi:hypothetical protein
MPLALAPTRLGAAVAVAVASLALPTGAVAKKSASPKLPAKFQKRYHVKSATADPDKDGLTNFTEYRAHTSPKKGDTDKDGTPDGSEDRDKDKLDNATEQRAGTNPDKKDSDRDGKADGREDADHDGLNNLAEQRTANDPGDPDSDDDGTKDGAENAGQIVAFDDGSGLLTLRLASTGKVVAATVDAETSVDCSATEAYEDGYDDGAAGDTLAAEDGDAADDDAAADDDGSDAGDDDGADASGDDAGDDDAEASAASVRRADEGDDDASDDPVLADDEDQDNLAGGDDCADSYLDAGAWVHEATLATGDDGARVFDAVALVTGD